MKKLLVGQKLKIVFFLFIILALANFFAIRYFNNTRDLDGAIVDAAGRNRMLSQQLGFYAEQIIHGNEAAKITLQEIITLHNTSFYALKNGGAAPGIDHGQILPPSPAKILPLAKEAENLWLKYKESGEIIANEPTYINGVINPAVANALDFIEKNALEMLQKNDAVVKAYVKITDEKQRTLHLILLVLLMINIIILGSGVWFAIIINKKSESLASDLLKFKLAVDSSSNQVIITDQEGIVIYGNKALERITGYELKEVLGKKVGKLWKKPMDKNFYANLWNTIQTNKKVFIGEIANRRKNGQEYQAHINISPVLDKDGKIIFFVGIERDITKEKSIDKVKTEFVSLASHQLRTPLTAISWYTEMLLAGNAGKLNKKQAEYVTIVYQSDRRMVELVDSLLNVSRLDLGTFMIEPEPTDIVALAQSVTDELRPQIEQRKLKFSNNFDADLPKINADPKLLRMVFQNLLSNAVKYTPTEGIIEFSISLDEKNKNVLFSVTDTGYGIPKNQQDKIFNKLFRADNVRSKDTNGTGLGLYIVKSIIDISGGKIWFESEENKGTTFYFILPMSGMKKREGEKTLV